MKTIALQLVTVDLENGERGVFVGGPLVNEMLGDEDCQIDEVWFSDVQELPDDLTLGQLMKIIRAQVCRCAATMQ